MSDRVLAAPLSAFVRRRAARRAGAAGAASRPPYVLLAIVAALVVVALAGPWLAPQDPDSVDLLAALQPPSSAHLLGTDGSGRDILSRLLTGARSSLLAPLVVTVVATLLGSVLAIVGAWRGGWVDGVVARLLDVLFSFPGLLLAILAAAVFGTGLTAPVIALCISYVPYVARIVRSAAVRERALPYVSALELQGLAGFAICARHLVPNVATTIGAQAAITFGYAMVDLAAINFLGLGLESTSSDWGVMVAAGQSSILRGRPEEALFAGVAIVIAVVTVNLLAQRLERGAVLESPR
ncbi:ABC transporter permease [Conexibacter stalactiti]|uniref:ABC transporter permease n=1 Tax=Conexibacter stalactiti TaxID=1940611 RepID=A0ABU4HJH2_9ACTN|nr:ABC transporter permease [Conexibacter stalactiti]MDW5593400.1 ABC transporter permease [Conexibacter stalactiti]MEC5034041.1 ABC transporter permease [Conexibacter stalactiti]